MKTEAPLMGDDNVRQSQNHFTRVRCHIECFVSAMSHRMMSHDISANRTERAQAPTALTAGRVDCAALLSSVRLRAACVPCAPPTLRLRTI